MQQQRVFGAGRGGSRSADCGGSVFGVRGSAALAGKQGRGTDGPFLRAGNTVVVGKQSRPPPAGARLCRGSLGAGGGFRLQLDAVTPEDALRDCSISVNVAVLLPNEAKPVPAPGDAPARRGGSPRRDEGEVTGGCHPNEPPPPNR